MNVYKKLQKARVLLQNKTLTKSGKNKFVGYEYFELGDFIPAIQNICDEVGLCGVVNYTHDIATLTIQDTDAEGQIVFASPMSTAALKGCHEVQNLGAVQSYLRRYLWMTAFEIVEHDALDQATGNTSSPDVVVTKPKVAPKPAAAAPKPAAVVALTEDQNLFIQKMEELGEADPTGKALSGLWKANLKQLEQLEKQDIEAHTQLKEYFRTIKKDK